MIIDYDSVVNKLAADLDLKVMRSKLVASNVANIDTPQYKSKDMSFQKIMTDTMGSMEMKCTHPLHISDPASMNNPLNDVVEDAAPGRPDGNNVNIDEEMLKLNEINIQYTVASQLVSRKLRMYQDALSQSR